MDTAADYRDVNRAMWDERVAIHVASRFYDVEGFRHTPDVLRPFELEELGDVSGRTLLHLQCHIGLDTLSWARHGAQVTGLDFSPEAVDAARRLASDIEVAAEFVVADVYEAPAALDGRRFDVVYTGIGALCWLPDIDRWAQTVAQLLTDGGVLYLVEFHPLASVLDDETGTRVRNDYFQREPLVYEYSGTYADPDARAENALQVEFRHSLGDIVTAVSRAGLRVEMLHEFPFTLFQELQHLERSDDGLYHQPAGTPRIPLLYSLRARAS